jgi:tRNA1Val (adenine37-N6)-methyltransferase
MKSSAHFHFKKFRIAHDRSTHKVGTDGVLLGAWVAIENVNRILDIGTGTGVIALMVAQRTPPEVQIDAVEFEKEDAAQATENVLQSPWPGKIKVYHTAIQDFHPDKKYDLMVSNPPYFVNSSLPPEKKRSQARHTRELSFEDLLYSAHRLLAPSGRLAVILPFEEGLTFLELAKGRHLYCQRQCAFRSRSHKPIERWLFEFGDRERAFVNEELVLYDDGEAWSAQYRRITQDFYLNI